VPSDSATELYQTGQLGYITISVARYRNFDIYDEAFCSLGQQLITKCFFFCIHRCMQGMGCPLIYARFVSVKCIHFINSNWWLKLLTAAFEI